MLVAGVLVVVVGEGKTVGFTEFGLGAERAAALAAAAVVFGFINVRTAFALVPSLPIESLLSMVGLSKEGSGLRSRKSPRVNSIFTTEPFLYVQYEGIF